MRVHGREMLEEWRVLVLGLLFLLAGGALAARLWVVQVVRSAQYEGQAARQSIRRVLVAAPRGRLLDRNGVVLAEDRPNVCLAVYMEELRQPGRRTNTVAAVDAQIDRVCAFMEIRRETRWEEIWRHSVARQPMPLVIAEHLDEAQVARFVENMEGFAGVDVMVDLERHYPLGELACHTLGYVQRHPVANPPDAEAYHYAMKGARGAAGLEARHNAALEGTPGVRLMRVDAAGYRHEDRDVLAPRAGADVTLTLDARLQAALERSLAAQRGAGVVLDARNGDVLAMASLPGYDANDMSPSPSRAFWHSLTNDPGRPLFNRATQGRYPPGSTFKVIVALGMLNDGRITGDEEYACTGVFNLGPRPVRCSNGAVHGVVNLHDAIRVSCNGYFCRLGQLHGYAPVHNMARALGFGERTGIDLPGEAAGLLPDEAWKRRAMNEPWYPGDTCLVCIGQGTLLATPLQMASAAATIANGGRVVKPRLCAGGDARGETVREFRLGFEDLQKVRDGMSDVTRVGGTGSRAGGVVEAAGKTGTAEYSEGGLAKKHAWMIAYAPSDNPEIAMAFIIEDGDSGGRTAAPVVRDVLAAWFGEK